MKELMANTAIQYIICAVLGGLVVKVREIRAKSQKRDGEIEKLKAATLENLRYNLLNFYERYEQRQCIPVYARSVLDGLFTQYESFGGNGDMKDLVKKMYSWKTRPDCDQVTGGDEDGTDNGIHS